MSGALFNEYAVQYALLILVFQAGEGNRDASNALFSKLVHPVVFGQED
jgi:hypothetical protein